MSQQIAKNTEEFKYSFTIFKKIALRPLKLKP